MCKRIYSSYKIRVTNEEGEKYIELNRNIDETSYSTMLKYYHMTKYKHQEEDCIIELLGVYEDGSIGSVIFSKTFFKEVNNDKELLRPTDEIVKEIKGLLDLLNRKNEYHNNMYSAFNKKQDVLLHKIESIKSFEGKENEIIEEKLKIIDELEQVRHDRRFNNDEMKKIQIVNKKVNLKNISEKFSSIQIPINTDNYEYIGNKGLEEKIIKEIKYNSEKQRINIVSQVQHKYSKIINDEARKTLVCFNYRYHCNK